MDSIRENAQKILWECERQKRLEHNLLYINRGKAYQRLIIEGVYDNDNVFLRLEDLTKQSQEVILECIKNQILKCKD